MLLQRTKASRREAMVMGLRRMSDAAPSTPPIKIFPRAFRTRQFGVDVLHEPLFNKGTAFNNFERDRLGIRGLLPPAVKTIEEQRARVMRQLETEPDNESKNMYLQDLQSRNETLYFNVLVNNIEKMAPLVYTPTVGTVCEKFGHQFRRTRGMYFSREDRGQMSSIIYNWPHDDVHVIVVTDGSRILGLGDLGVNGMGIPIGKLALYTACGGIAPHRVLPVTLDVGTNNQNLIKDPDYLGTREPRLTGPEYYEMIDEFMHAVFHRWPNVIVQFEDFESSKAVPLLERYREKYRMFNDDIQGTGSVTLSGLLSAIRNAGGDIKDSRIVCAGAGSAGLGVCLQIIDGMVEAGMSRKEAFSRFAVCTSKGALGKADGKFGDPNHKRGLTDIQSIWLNESVSDGMSLAQTVNHFKPNILLGLSTVPKIFDETVIRSMAKINKTPIIMPMSNPTSKSECTAEEAYRWTDGRAVVASGSPFAPVKLADGRTVIPSQCNNMYIFPGIGLGASVSGVTKITNKMLYLASAACTNSMTPAEIAEGRTFPNINRIREVSRNVAVAVIEEGLREGLTTKIGKAELEEGIPALVARKMYYPVYMPVISRDRR
mmetsp:Transcript_85591/g.228201  ORF Transcript_85591/g.228201 Transcript_85591/m.228201 type:complete len:600 (+) Transcript_85591:54-1853(+)